MGYQNKTPGRWAGACIWSGAPSTGETATTRGGGATITVYSGGLITLGSGGQIPVSNPGTGHAVFVSGPGRLGTTFAHVAASGVQVTFYDSNVVALSGTGTWMNSGYRVLGTITANNIGDQTPSLGGGPLPVQVDIPFSVGLAVDCASGCPGFSVTYSPDVIPASGTLTYQ